MSITECPAMLDAPRDGTWIEVRDKDNGKWFIVWWNPKGTSWDEVTPYPIRSGTWMAQDQGWFQPNEVDEWRHIEPIGPTQNLVFS